MTPALSEDSAGVFYQQKSRSVKERKTDENKALILQEKYVTLILDLWGIRCANQPVHGICKVFPLKKLKRSYALADSSERKR